MSRYVDELRKAMLLLEEAGAVFMGQAVEYPGTGMSQTLEHLGNHRLELPVAEDMQMGMAIGMSLAGLLPVCIYPRWNFLLLATNQLVLHLDKLPLYSEYRPKVIIRVAVATNDPLDPGPQHLGDFSRAFRDMLRTVAVARLHTADDVMISYRAALARAESTILVEYSKAY